MSAINTQMVKKEARKAMDKPRADKSSHEIWKEKMLANAEKMEVYAGKRFLGYTARGAEVWISMEFTRKTGELKVEATHNLEVLLEEGAKLVDRRISVRKFIHSHLTTADLIRRARGNSESKMNKTSLQYLQKLIDGTEIKFPLAFDKKGRPTALWFQYVTGSIYAGDYDTDRGDTSWSYIIEAWKEAFAKESTYFTLDSVPIVED